MRAVKKVFRNLAIGFVAIFTLLFLLRNVILNKVLENEIKRVTLQARAAGIGINNLHVERMSVHPFNTIRLYDIQSDVTLPNRLRLDTSFSELKLKMNFTYYILEVKGEDFLIQAQAKENADNRRLSNQFSGRISSPRLRISLMVSKDDMQKTIRSLVKDANELLTTGHTSLNLSLNGTLTFPYKGEKQEAQIKTLRKDGITSLQLDRDSVLELIGTQATTLTEAELELIGNNPLRAAKLLEIKDYADRQAQKNSVLPNFPKDAFRHVLWNFLLTKTYDEKFAKEVTDAHELGSSNSEFDSRMDYNNNAIGRKYALIGVLEDQLVKKVLTDPNIIRQTDR
ncbi:MAG: hypothetical protein VX278_08220 [Myxococcota bacterium]|nr:hypothetical protein [Myxococcota bacterium]